MEREEMDAKWYRTCWGTDLIYSFVWIDDRLKGKTCTEYIKEIKQTCPVFSNLMEQTCAISINWVQETWAKSINWISRIDENIICRGKRFAKGDLINDNYSYNGKHYTDYTNNHCKESFTTCTAPITTTSTMTMNNYHNCNDHLHKVTKPAALMVPTTSATTATITTWTRTIMTLVAT